MLTRYSFSESYGFLRGVRSNQIFSIPTYIIPILNQIKVFG